jgi:3-hydroxyisobutyrate dehydrogenase-like beta-hydroxyacid dehydrogenase
MADKPRIGILGMGTMGGPMARRLVESGFVVTGYEPDQTRAGKAKADGVALAVSPARVAEASDMVLSSLPDVATVRRAYEAGDGAIAGARAGMTFIDVSTTDPESWREVAKAARAKGVECLDAPVSGGPADAGSGKLTFLIGGEADVLERCRPVLNVLGHEIHHIGPLGSGQILKIVNNVMSVGNVAVAAEAMVLGVRAGLDPQRLYDILSTSGGRSHHFIKRFPNVLAGDFTPYFGINLSRKDVALGLNMAASLGLPMPVTSAVRQTYDTAHAEGFGSLDMAGVISLYEKWAGVEVRSKGGANKTGPGVRS